VASDIDRVTRREFLLGAGALALSASMPTWASQKSDSLGEWIDDDLGLPCYRYTGPLRFSQSPTENNTVLLPDDPIFLFGNYRLTLFTHASGIFQMLTGERAWGRMNQGDKPYSGANQASIEFSGQTHQLIGPDQLPAIAASKRFGVGFARYDYVLSPSLQVSRLLSVLPSTSPEDGTSAFLVQVQIRNTGSSPLDLRYAESTRARYQQIFSPWAVEKKDISWTLEPPSVLSPEITAIGFTPKPKDLLAFPPKGEAYLLEQFPPSLFVHSFDHGAKVFTESDANNNSSAGIRWSETLKGGEQRDLAFVIGYTRDTSLASIEALAQRLKPAKPISSTQCSSAFAKQWRQIVPAFADETDLNTRREMQWNVAVLESMATWREYYNETVVPQGTVYDYTWGNMASSRDLAQHALPLCHTNPSVARSVLRFLMKRTVPDGDIKLNDEGFGWSPSGAQQTSDQQLFFFLLLAEYLRVTKDTSILRDQIGYYPLHCSGHDTGLAHVRQAFSFLRDRIGVGPHGIVRRWNSDWNDMFFFWPTTMPYNRMFEEGESHMNSAMAIVILGDLANALDSCEPAAGSLTATIREYRSQLLHAWMTDLGSRTFPRRAWTSYSSAIGDREMWLEPQGFALLIPEFADERKHLLFAEVQKRLIDGETMGARQIEQPVQQPGTSGGSRENGGFWYALNGPLILGVATFDLPAAQALLRRMSFTNFARSFPEYWTGRWSASDSLDSSLLKTNGLSENIIYCAHAHAWPLYCWLRLRSS
jgi:Glycosyl hydrolase 36 superfamily, catalytic domain